MNTNGQMVDTDSSPVADITEELVIDTHDHDIFSSLDDLTVESDSTQENDIEDSAATEEAAEDDNFDFEDIDEDAEIDEDGGIVETEEEDDDEDEDDEEYYEDEDEEYEDEDEESGDIEEEVEYEGYMVNLPDGSEVNLSEAVKGYRDAQQVEQMKQEFEENRQNFLAGAENMMQRLELSKLEADRVIDDYNGFDWVTLSREDPQKYVDNREFLDQYKQRRDEIVHSMQQMKQEEQQQQQQQFQNQAQTCVDQLRQDIPGWNDDMYQDMMEYAVQAGAKEDEIIHCVDPTIFKILHKAMQFDTGRRVVKAKVRRAVNSPRKVVKAAAKSSGKPKSKKATLIKKMEAGEMDGDVFANLED